MEITAVERDVELEGATLVVGLMAGLVAAPGSEEIVDQLDSSVLEAAGFEGAVGQKITVPHALATAVLAIGLGEEVSYAQIRSAMGEAIRAAKTDRVVCYFCPIPVEGATRAAVEGAILGGYVFRRYKSDDNSRRPDVVEMVDADQADIDAAVPAAEATNLARDWVNTPAGDMSPVEFSEAIESAATSADVSIEIWDESRIADESLGALVGVAAGSRRPPRLVILRYEPDEGISHLGLVGKGITFDAGGLSIKPAKSMEEMKDDMAGAAAVAAATIAIARLGIPVRVTAVIPITDNVIGGNATRPGDVLRPVAGPSIEVLNTDAEGRLILADGLGVVAGFEPDLTIDVATLTASAHVALGDEIAALFASSPEVAATALDAASRAGEELWQLPLFEPYRKSLESEVADIKNSTGSRYGGAIAAALFLSNYAGDGSWAHLDIAGPARRREMSGEQVKGASGYGVRTLVEIARAVSKTS